MIPGAAPELVSEIGFIADRLSVNIELPTEKSLKLLAPQKNAGAIFKPMKQITNTLIEQNGLIGPGTMFKGQELNTDEHYIKDEGLHLDDRARTESYEDKRLASAQEGNRTDAGRSFGTLISMPKKVLHPQKSLRGFGKYDGGAARRRGKREPFVPAGQTTQMIIGASGETDRQILKLLEDMYRIFKMKRVFSARM